MAKIGLKYVAWAKMATEPDNALPTYETGFVLGKAVSASLSVTLASGEFYADDALAESVEEFVSGNLALEVDNITLPNQAILFGSDYVDGEIGYASDDTAPYGGIGGYQVLLVGGNRIYRTWFFPKAKAAITDWNGTTKGSSVSFGTEPINLKVSEPNYGKYRYCKDFSTEAAARAYIDSKLGVAATYTINVQANGAGEGDSVSPVGVVAVSGGTDFTLTIEGTATKLYDNGTDNTSAISEGVYTVSNVTADHNITVIF